MNLKNLIKDNTVYFDSYRAGFFYYNIVSRVGQNIEEGQSISNYDIYQFTVPVDDIGTATLLCEDKAITFMRWIRKAIESNTLLKLKLI